MYCISPRWITVLLCLSYNSVVAKNSFFRNDYTFLEETQSFYKLHTIHRDWLDSKKRCEMEGAKLFYPVDSTETQAVLTYMNKTQPTYHWVYVGISDRISFGAFETIDGISISEIYNVWALEAPNDFNGDEDCVILHRDGKYNDVPCTPKYPFICKKPLALVEWNVLCDLPDIKYLYSSEMGRCYKFHRRPMNWTEAYSYCNAEQSYLAVVNSKKEAAELVKIAEAGLKNKLSGEYLRDTILLGFHNRDKDGWETVKGVSLDETGYSLWADQQPDDGRINFCGSMFFNGSLNDVDCNARGFFICEHDVGLLGTKVDDRIGHRLLPMT